MTLKSEQLQSLRKLIEERRKALAIELRGDAGRSRGETFAELAGSTHDLGDESVADLLADIGHAELSRDLAELRDVELARQRLADGSYGVCSDCATDIAYERLRVQPAASRCVSCQQRFEQTHAGRGASTL